jgi:hypothetical protein
MEHTSQTTPRASARPGARAATAPTRRRLPRGRGDDGAIIIEAALVSPVFFLLILGIFEFSMALGDWLALNNGMHAAARAAAIYGNDRDTDYNVLQSVKREIGVISTANFQRVVVFKAAGVIDPSAPYCTTGASSNVGGVTTPGVGSCNVYVAADFNKVPESGGVPTGHFRCTGGAIDRFYCPINRKTAVAGTNGPPDFIGIYIQAQHPFATRLFGNAVTLSNTTITRLEPKTAR